MFEAFQFGPFLFRTQVLFLLVGIWLGAELLFRTVEREGIRMGIFLRQSFWYLIAFFLGGRLLAILLLYRVYLQHPEQMLIFWDGAFSAVGGVIGIASIMFLRTRRTSESFLQWLDLLFPSITLLFMFNWIGNFFGANAYGKPTDMPWGVIFESIHVRYTVPVHPVQLYFAALFFGVTVLLLFLRSLQRQGRMRGSTDTQGLVTIVGVLLAGLGSVILEFFRGDFAVMVFAKPWDFLFLGLLFVSLGMIAALEQRLSYRYSLMNSIFVGIGTVIYILVRSMIPSMSLEWRFSQFLSVLAMIAVVVYVVVRRWRSSRS